MGSRMFVCRESFFATVDGVPRPFVAGKTLVSEDSDVYRLHPERFREAVAQYRSDAEQATAAPGERRAVKLA